MFKCFQSDYIYTIFKYLPPKAIEYRVPWVEEVRRPLNLMIPFQILVLRCQESAMIFYSLSYSFLHFWQLYCIYHTYKASVLKDLSHKNIEYCLFWSAKFRRSPNLMINRGLDFVTTVYSLSDSFCHFLQPHWHMRRVFRLVMVLFVYEQASVFGYVDDRMIVSILDSWMAKFHCLFFSCWRRS